MGEFRGHGFGVDDSGVEDSDSQAPTSPVGGHLPVGHAARRGQKGQGIWEIVDYNKRKVTYEVTLIVDHDPLPAIVSRAKELFYAHVKPFGIVEGQPEVSVVPQSNGTATFEVAGIVRQPLPKQFFDQKAMRHIKVLSLMCHPP